VPDQARATCRSTTADPHSSLACLPVDPREDQPEEAATTLELALPLLDEAAGGHVEGAIGDSDPFAAVEQAVERGGFDEVIISTLFRRASRTGCAATSPIASRRSACRSRS
jgi:hypothetical protein